MEFQRRELSNGFRMKATAENPYPKTFEEFLKWFQSNVSGMDTLAGWAGVPHVWK
jgi:hypothetical protein